MARFGTGPTVLWYLGTLVRGGEEFCRAIFFMLADFGEITILKILCFALVIYPLTCNFVVVFGPKHRLLCCGSFYGNIATRIMALLVENATAKVDQVTIRQFQLKNKKSR